ncbi:MAG: hypothetical protein L7U45_07405 [Alphaproteobacteria bacterium]|nr:hypothetical protein [Alphaproteobacteria bacterium]
MSSLRLARLMLVFVASLFIGAAHAEWKSEPPEIMAGGEIIGQYYHLFSKTEPPHLVWVSYQNETYLCRGDDAMFRCQSTKKGAMPPAPVTADETSPPAP